MGNKIVQRNDFIKFKGNMELNEKRLLFTLMSMIDEGDTEFKEQRLRIKDIGEEWGMGDKSAYSRLVEAAKSLNEKNVYEEYFGENEKNPLQLVTMQEHEKGSGYIEIKIHDDLKPYLLNPSENFTVLDYSTLKKLPTNAMRMYELIKSHGERWICSFTELKKLFGVEDLYKYPNNFERRIIIPALKELNERTELKVTYETIGRGKTKEVRFNWSEQKETQTAEKKKLVAVIYVFE